jgi:general L-amino acid transport system substrate-binding protein
MPRGRVLTVTAAIFALVVVACEAAPPGPTPNTTTGATGSPTASAAPVGQRLQAVRDWGQLICGVNGGLQGFSFLDEQANTWSGFDADFCRAVAAAVLGDANAVEFRALSTEERGPALQAGEIDVLIRNTTWTASRDATWGDFGPTTFYDGQGMMVNTTRTQATTLEDLAGATICVQSGTTTELNLNDQMQVRGIDFEPIVFDDIDATYSAYVEGRCDAVTSDRSQLVGRRSAFANADEHVLLEVVMSKEPLGPVVPHGDDRWFDVVKWVVYATIQAEELGITQANVAQMRADAEAAGEAGNPVVLRLLGVQPAAGSLAADLGLEDDWVVDVITAVGNYGEIFNRNVGPDTPLGLERGLNNLWTADPPGLLYAPPYR